MDDERKMLLSSPMGMTTTELIAAYRILQLRGANEDDLHDAIVEMIPRMQNIQSPLNYMARVTAQKRSARTRSTLPMKEEATGIETPSDTLIRQERTAAVEDALSQLSEREQLVVQLRFSEELDWTTVARRTGSSPSAVRAVFCRAKKPLTSSLEQLQLSA